METKTCPLCGCTYETSCVCKNVAIRHHDWKPSMPIFHREDGDPKTYFGVELEQDSICSSDLDLSAWRISILDDGNLFYVKHDSSLNDGYEIVSHPCTINWWMNNRQFLGQAFEYANDSGLAEWETCGMHVHVSRKYLVEYQILNLVNLVEIAWYKLLAMTRRHVSAAQSFADKQGRTRHKLSDCDVRKFLAVNLVPDKTIELRFFGPVHTVGRTIAHLQLAEILVELAGGLSTDEVMGFNAGNIVELIRETAQSKDYNELVNIINNTDFIYPELVDREPVEEDEPDYTYCNDCGCRVDENNVYWYRHEQICEDCYSVHLCPQCGDETDGDDRTLCSDCISDGWVYCNNCGDLINPHNSSSWTHANHHSDGEWYCNDCMGRLKICYNCGVVTEYYNLKLVDNQLLCSDCSPQQLEFIFEEEENICAL